MLMTVMAPPTTFAVAYTEDEQGREVRMDVQCGYTEASLIQHAFTRQLQLQVLTNYRLLTILQLDHAHAASTDASKVYWLPSTGS